MTQKEYLEKKARAEFKEGSKLGLNYWYDRVVKSFSAKSEWEKAADICHSILSMQIPEEDKDEEIIDQSSHYMIYPWLAMSVQLLMSQLLSAEVTYLLKSFIPSKNLPFTPEKIILEHEMNFLHSEFDYDREIPQVLRDAHEVGFGSSFYGWNTRRRTDTFDHGTPEFTSVNPYDVAVDPGCKKSDWSDRRWTVLRRKMDLEEAKEIFPDYDFNEEFPNTSLMDSKYEEGKTEIYLIQYYRTYTAKMIDIKFTRADNTFEKVQVLADEYIENANKLPENAKIDTLEDGSPAIYEAEAEHCFQIILSKYGETLLSEAEYVGSRDNFQFLINAQVPGDIYPRSKVYMLKDLHYMSMIQLTTLALHAVRENRPLPILEEGGLKNENEFRTSGQSLNFVAVTRKGWRDQNRQLDPLKFITPQMNVQIPMLIGQSIEKAMQEFTGATNASRGLPSTPGESGVLNSQLMNGSFLYTRYDHLQYENYLRDIGNQSLFYIAKYRSYEHEMQSVDGQGNDIIMLINAGNISVWNPENYSCEPEVVMDPDAVRQLQEDKAIQLAGAGMMSKLDALKYQTWVENAEQKYMNAQQEQGTLEIVQALQKYPQLAQMFWTGFQQLQQASQEADITQQKKAG